MSIRYLIGDVFDRMAELETDSVDLILTSPPFLALRSYLPADHPDKSKEIGSEATPAEYIDVLLRLTAEWRRLLAPHGSLVVELGDTFSGSGGAGGDYNDGGWREAQPAYRQGFDRGDGRKTLQQEDYGAQGVRNDGGPGWPLAKSLTLIPESYRFALAYGINPHTGATSPAGQWRIRNVIRWVRPNPPVGALGDKFRPATSELVVACTSKDRFFDLDAVRDPNSDMSVSYHAPDSKGVMQTNPHHGWDSFVTDGVIRPNPAGAPPLDWWKISPKGFSGAHYAVWPSELCVKPIKAMCPEKVCRTCGEPSRRIAETTNGWSDCGHDDYRAGLVLDPFAGTGTTLAVAHGHGRDAIGIDIDEKSAELAIDRIGPLFLEIEYA